jgi:hypothetical protein
MADEIEYFRRRLDDELDAFHSSGSDAAEQCHRLLAHAYSRKLVELGRREEAMAAQRAA